MLLLQTLIMHKSKLVISGEIINEGNYLAKVSSSVVAASLCGEKHLLIIIGALIGSFERYIGADSSGTIVILLPFRKGTISESPTTHDSNSSKQLSGGNFGFG